MKYYKTQEEFGQQELQQKSGQQEIQQEAQQITEGTREGSIRGYIIEIDGTNVIIHEQDWITSENAVLWFIVAENGQITAIEEQYVL